MTWAHALRRPRVEWERREEQLATSGDLAVLERLNAALPGFVPMARLGGHAGSQAVYRLRNTYGRDIIETLTGRGYRLSPAGERIAADVTCSSRELRGSISR